MEKIISVRNLKKRFESGTQALDGIDLDIYSGEFIALVGLSGSGKSTLLRCLNMLNEPTSGSITYLGNEITNLKGKKLRLHRRRIGMIFQQFNLIKNLSVLTNVLSGKLGYTKVLNSLILSSNKKNVIEAKRNLDKVKLSQFSDQKVKNLSGGQQQRVAIARALMQNPQVILADEPIASLDPATADSVMKYLGELNREEKITVICSLHFLSFARKYGSRIVALKDGRIAYDGTIEDFDENRFREIYGDDSEEVSVK
ncbi:MAG: phosphonate ABC transporter ATP-binding protein [Candidatus Cloacimonetes bacterium]|nr:phosphonate ABC transporter ATP-binding protein [Candidatus Cloacimonadota bacterium]